LEKNWSWKVYLGSVECGLCDSALDGQAWGLIGVVIVTPASVYYSGNQA
jgi:hypothetical protein